MFKCEVTRDGRAAIFAPSRNNARFGVMLNVPQTSGAVLAPEIDHALQILQAIKPERL